MNMLRVPGTGAYESGTFHDLCDELGILVWQDFMFANLDYPERDPEFMAAVQREARAVLATLGGRPSLAVVCGGSEIAQQVAMLGLDPELANGPLFGELLPSLVEDAEIDAPYLPSAPWGGDLPFRTDRGIANYYGVGAYRRPLEDARRAEVRFASECLAFANVPDDEALVELEAQAPGALVVHHPRWKAGVPRDPGAGWDFDDVRDHYLELLFGVDPSTLLSFDYDRYLELSRAVSGEVMSEVLGEWRRHGSPCGGAIVLWLSDLVPGAGWGLLDHRGEPKAVYHHVRRALAPVAAWTTDEGLGGMAVHVANDRPEPLLARLRIATYRDQELRIRGAEHPLELRPHTTWVDNLERLLGGFVDVSWAYRFGPPAQDLVAVSLERASDQEVQLLSQCFRLPVGRPTTRETPERLGFAAEVEQRPDGGLRLTIRSRRFAYGVRVHAPGFDPDDDAFCVEPGGLRLITLARREAERAPAGAIVLSALNLAGRVTIPVDGSR
jgi:beta-mannosidase